MDGEGYYDSYRLKKKEKARLNCISRNNVIAFIAVCFTCSINGLNTPNILCEIHVYSDT